MSIPVTALLWARTFDMDTTQAHHCTLEEETDHDG